MIKYLYSVLNDWNRYILGQCRQCERNLLIIRVTNLNDIHCINNVLDNVFIVVFFRECVVLISGLCLVSCFPTLHKCCILYCLPDYNIAVCRKVWM